MPPTIGGCCCGRSGGTEFAPPPSSALPPSAMQDPDSSSWQRRNFLACSSVPVLEDHDGRGEALPEGVAARGVQPHPRFHLPCLETFGLGFPASSVISSSTNHFVIHMWLLGSGFGSKLQNNYVRVDKLTRCSLAIYAVMCAIDGFVRALVHKDSCFRLLRALVSIMDYWCIMQTTDDLLLLWMSKEEKGQAHMEKVKMVGSWRNN